MKQAIQHTGSRERLFVVDSVTNRRPIIFAVLLLALFAFSCNSLGGGGSDDTPIPTEIQITPVEGLQVVVVADVATLRSGPGIEFEQVGTLQQGRIVRVVGEAPAQDWYLITVPRSEGGTDEAWISTGFVAPITPTPPPTYTDTPVSPPTYTDTPVPFPTDTLPPSPTEVPIVPSTPSPIVCELPSGWVHYTVQSGDTLFNISNRYGVTVAQLQTANCLGNITVIQIGQLIYVPNVPTSTLIPPDTPTVTPTASPTPTNTSLPVEKPTDTPPAVTGIPPVTAIPPGTTTP